MPNFCNGRHCVVAPETGRFTKEAEDFAKSSKSYGMLVLAMGMIVFSEEI